MSSSAREQFIEAGMHLYPQYGYRQLSVRLLAAETGLSSGMFHHLFASKADFVAELLESQNADTFGRLDFRTDEHACAVAKLRHAVCLLAGGVRDNLAWINRIFADSADGVETADTFLRQNSTAIRPGCTNCSANVFPKCRCPTWWCGCLTYAARWWRRCF